MLAWWMYPFQSTSFVWALTILPLTCPASEFQSFFDFMRGVVRLNNRRTKYHASFIRNTKR